MRVRKFVVALAALLMVSAFVAPAVKADDEIDITYAFTDEVLREYASNYIDIDKNGKLSQAEIDAVTTINLRATPVVRLDGIERFKNLYNLNLRNCDLLKEINLNDMPELELIDVAYIDSPKFSIVLTNCPKVRSLEAFKSNLSLVYLNDCPIIEIVDVSMCTGTLSKITIANCPNLVKAYRESTNVFSNDEVGYTDFSYDGADVEYFFSCDNTCTVIDEFPAGSVPITPEIFADVNFRRLLITNYDDKDGYLSPDEIKVIKSIDFTPTSITSIKGVEYLTSLESFTASLGSVSEVDLSHNTELTYLDLEMNNISSIDLSHNTKLETLYLADNNLSSLDISMLPNLSMLSINSNNLNSLYIHNNPGLIDAYTNGEHKTYSGEGYSYEEYVVGVFDKFIFVDTSCTVYTTAPAPTTRPTQTPTTAPNQPTTPATTPETGVAGFVERLYTVALGRKSDPNGKANWIAAIRGGESGADAAKGFLFSDEFLNKNMSNADFVTVLYKTFFDRQPDAAGHAGWVAALERGESKQDVIMGFINSTEWANVCLKYGINSGGTGVANIVVEPNEQVIAFATRLYTTCLKRTPDSAGLMAWARQLANLRDTGTNAAHGFFFSDELNGAGIDDAEFITRLYLTFMDREPDTAGFRAWMTRLASGDSREEVFNGFAQSDEFGRICANYGIIR